MSAVRAVSFRVLSFCFVILGALAAAAQTSVDDVHITPRLNAGETTIVADARPYGEPSLIRTGTSLVMVPVSITDGLNRPVVGLDQDNFEVFENKKPQAIKNFSSEDAPVSIGILVDSSGSMGYKLERVRDAVRQFCEEANPQDEFFLITFSDVPRLATDFTNNAANVENDLLTANSKGETALLDAIYMGLRKMRDARYARRALLILSDGGDNHSRYSEHDIRAAIKESDITIYAVGTYERAFSTQEELLGPELLSSVAELSGGRAFTLTNEAELPAVTRNIGTRLRHQYMLAYQPQSTPHDGKWHKISVKLRLPKKFPFLRVDARPGYYDNGAD